MLEIPRNLGALAAGVLVAGCSCLRAQCPPPIWSAMNEIPGLDSAPPASTVWDPDGAGPAAPMLVVGGAFGTAGPTTVHGVAAWDGTSWHALGWSAYPWCNALAVHNGDLVGAFTTPGSFSYVIGRWNGSSWQQLGSGATDIWVHRLAVYNGDLIASGSFTHIGGAAASFIARWDGTAWSSLGGGLNAFADPLLVHNGELFVGGGFTVAGGVGVSYVARWNGSSWQTVGGGVNNGVYALAAYNGDVIAGGNFTTAGGAPASSVARWDGSAWSPIGSGISIGGLGPTVRALAVHNGDLVAGGGFATAGSVSAARVARWDGSSWYSLGLGLGGPSQGAYATAWTLAVLGGDLFAGGTFTTAGSVQANAIARWDGSTWSALGSGLPSPPRAFATWNGDLVAGSYGTNFHSAYVSRWDGSAWHTLGPGVYPEVGVLEVYGGELVACGNFSPAGLTSNAAKWAGSGWAPLGAGPPHAVVAMTVYNGDLIAAGIYATRAISRWDGSSWQALGLGGPTSSIYTVATYNGDLIAGGLFTGAVGAPPCNFIARWDGQAWFPMGSGVNGSVYALAVYDGELIAGGVFTEAGGAPASRIARWNGAVWQPFASPVNLGSVSRLAVYEGELIVGGYPDNGLTRWNGSMWQPMGAPTATVTCLTVHAGALIVGGTFSTAGGVASPFVARWSSPRPLLKLWQPSGNGTGVEVTNRWLIPGHEYYNIVSFDLAPGGVGTGPYGGLWFNNFASLLQQVLLPVGSPPIHFAAAIPDVTFGPFPLPVGLAFEAISADVTGGVLGCVAPAQQYVVY